MKQQKRNSQNVHNNNSTQKTGSKCTMHIPLDFWAEGDVHLNEKKYDIFNEATTNMLMNALNRSNDDVWIW